MEDNSTRDLMIVLGIIAIALMGGFKTAQNGGLLGSQTPEQKQVDIERQIQDTQYRVEELKKQVQAEEDKKNQSQYKGMVKIYYVNRGYDSKNEYVMIHAENIGSKKINITGWTLKSLSSGFSVKIPQSTYLFFAGTVNSEEDIYLSQNDNLYLITGYSPNGTSFKVNKCSGYLNQFQTFTPYINTLCPAPRDENLSSIPKTPINDACLDYIDAFPTCRIQTESMPINWSYECTNFIYSKINYPSCVDTHKNDKDFWVPEWRVYLKRSERIWKDRREDIVLLDHDGKIVDEIKY